MTREALVQGTDSSGLGPSDVSSDSSSDLAAPFPLGPAQLGIWYAQLLNPDVPISMAQYVDIQGDFDVDLLLRVYREGVPIFRSSQLRFTEIDGRPMQYIDPEVGYDTALMDLRGEPDPVAAAHEWMRAEALRPVDVIADVERLFAPTLIRVAEQRWFWFVTGHHIVGDGYAAMNTMQWSARRYTALRRGLEPEQVKVGTLRELVDAEFAYRESHRFQLDREHWMRRTAGLEGGTTLKGRSAPPRAGNMKFGGTLPEALHRRIEEVGAQRDCGVSGVIVAAFAAYLARLTGKDEAVLSLPVTARTTAVMRRSTGMLSNIVPLRVPVGDDATWGGLLTSARVEISGALRHQRYRHEDIHRDAEQQGGVSSRALFGPMVNIMLFHSQLQFGDVTARMHLMSNSPIEDMSLNLYYEENDRIRLEVEVNPNLYTSTENVRHHRRFLDFLARLVELDPAARLADVDVCTELERDVVVRLWNDTVHPVDPAATLVSLFEEQAARTPAATALRFAGAPDLTYAEFAERVNRLARHLISLGIGQESLVALHLRRSPELLVALYAVQAAGGAYVPLDPDHPAERTAHILATAAPALVLATTAERPETDVTTLDLDALTELLAGYPSAPVTDADRLAPLRPANTAYVLFTSGSTGRPKGVMVSHAAIVNRLAWMRATYGMTAADVTLLKTPITFDVSVPELFFALEIGATLVIAQPDGHRDPAYLRATIAEYGVTTVHFVPSMLEAFLTELERDGAGDDLRTVRRVFISGEALPGPAAQRLRALTGASLHNLYGPTEAAVEVTYHEVTAADTVSVPIGAPVFNTRLYVLDARVRPVPVGTPGELYLSGVQLARGYATRPGLTAERFVADPFAAGELMYRTGDLVQWTDNGELEYLGRTDFQVKLRGLRIELGEIETVLAGVDGVARAVVIVRDEQLIAYVVGAADLDVARLQAAAGRALPGYMVPTSYMVLDALPVNASGKLDRAALPDPVRVAVRYEAPVTVTERAVARVFAEVLDAAEVGRGDDFFALGGNSLVATQVASRLNAELGCRLTVREMFGATSVSALAEVIDAQFVNEDAAAGHAIALVRRERPEPLPLSPAQQRIWFLNRFDTGSAGYNMPFVVRLRGAADEAAMGAALTDVLARHEVLRTVFPSTAAGFACQRVLEVASVAVPVDRETVDADELDTRLRAFATSGFDLEHEIPFRARLFTVTGAVADDCGLGGPVTVDSADLDVPDYAIAMVLHHIAADGLSLPILARDLLTAYLARVADQAPAWEPLAVQYADYTLWQRDRLGSAEDADSLLSRQLDFWRETLAGAPDLLELPADRPRPVIATGRGAKLGVELPAELHARIAETARGAGVSTFMLVHAALAVLLARLSGQSDIVIGTPVGGRGARELDDLIGMFVNTLPLRTEVDGRLSFDDLARRVRDTDLAAFAHGDVPFEQLVEVLNPPRSTARHPLFQVALSFTATGDISLELPGLLATTGTLDTGVTKFDLSVAVTESFAGAGPGEGPAPAGIHAEFEFALDLFDSATIEVFAHRFVRLLWAVTADPSVPVDALPVLSEDEYADLTTRSGAPVPAVRLLPEIMADAVAAAPDRIALIEKDIRFTYTELDATSNRLARLLIARGLGPEDLVAVSLPRSADYIVAVWAIAKTGAAWVPVDPAFPAERIDYIVRDAGAVLGLTVGAVRDALPCAVPWLLLDDAEFTAARAAFPAGPITDADRVRPLRAGNVVYSIYTSGSTGLPKGVVVTHSGLAGLSEAQYERFSGSPDARVLHVTSSSFDVSVGELLLALRAAATLVVAPTGAHIGDELAEVIRAHGVTHVFMTPSGASTIDPADVPSLRHVAVGGEAVSPELVRRWDEAGRELINAYGPTEATVVVNITRAIRTGATVTIGRLIPGAREWILDDRLRPVPVGAIGELYLGGLPITRGYRNRAELTVSRFVACPWAPGERMYRTGDLVRWTADGEVEYLGRNDSQVKLRGFRIELGEIEAALAALPQVRTAVVVLHHDAARGDQLVAYLVPAAGGVDVAQVRAALAERLTAYMIPSAFMVLDAMPMTVNGKLDYRALPAPVFTAREFRAPATPIELLVAEVFGEVLGLTPAADATPVAVAMAALPAAAGQDALMASNSTAAAADSAAAEKQVAVGADDDFFELGGNSLLATQVVARLGAALDTTVPVRLLFEASSVAELALRLAELAGAGGRPPLVAGERPEVVPLSYAQQRMWFLNRFDNSSVADNLVAAIRLDGPLDADALAAAVTDVVARHETLRTVYPAVDGVGRQLVLPVEESGVALALEPVQSPDPAARIFELAVLPFAVDEQAPARLTLLRLADETHVLVLGVHHIAADGWSITPLTRDLMLAYAARTAGEAPAWTPLPVQYADYTLWQRALLGSEDDPESVLAAQIRFWRAELAGQPDTLELPGDRPRPAVATRRGAQYRFTISAARHARLRELAEGDRATLFMALHAAYATLLAKLSGTSDISIGSVVAGRGEQALDELVGMFVNTVVLRTEVAPGRSFRELLAQVRDTDLRAFAHAEVPFELLVERLSPMRSQARHPLFQVALDLQNTTPATLELDGLRATRIDLDPGIAKFDLQLSLVEDRAAGGLDAVFTYATDLFDEATVAAFARRLDVVLDAVTATPDRPVGDIDLLTDDERARVLTDWNDTAHDLRSALPVGAFGQPTPATLVALFEARALTCPHAPAVEFEGTTLSYGEFADRVHRLARKLVEAGVGPESRVVLAIRRSHELLIGMYAILAAGGAYVPVDPDQPAQRTEYVLEAAGPSVVLTTARDGFAAGTDLPVLAVDTLDLSGYPATPLTDADRRAPLRESNACYVIFTSGSTGRPKGVAVSHAAVVNRLVWGQQRYRMTAADVVLQKTPFTFDVSVWEFFWPLQVGARLVVAAPDGHRDPKYLADLIIRAGISHAHFVPSMLAVFVTEPAVARCTSLRQVFASGEGLPAGTAFKLRELTGARLHNLYGPTEAAVEVTHHEVTDTDTAFVPMGRPVWNTRTYVLDGRLNPVAPGVAGELYLAGAQLARGYLGRPDLSADRFVANPFGTGERMYRTGDLVAWTADGELNYLGRTDFQVKLRGLRIELGEIEAALLAQPGVDQAVVLVRSDPHAGDQLAGYLRREPGHVIDLDAVKTALGGLLPSYMVPAAFVILDEFPVNTSGKLDRAALPAPVFETAAYRAPETVAEDVVAGVFADLLGIDRIGAYDDFFALGGSSLIAARVVARVGAALDAELSVRDLFDAPTVAGLAAVAESRSGSGALAPLAARPRPARVPLSDAQRRMWFLNRFHADTEGVGPGAAADNIPMVLRVSGPLGAAALHAALRDVVARHETLRTVYPDGPDGPVQQVLAAGAATLLTAPVTAGELADRITAVIARPFDLTAEIPVRAAVFSLSPDDHVLVLVVHHISSDGFSMGPLAVDFMTAYQARRADVAPGWTPLPVQYADYTLWQAERRGDESDPTSLAHRELAFWRQRLAGLPEQLELPTDRPRPAVASLRGGTHRVRVDAELHGGLLDLARAHETTLFSTVHAALAVLLARLSGGTDIAIGTPVAGRGHQQLDGLVGMFVNTLVLRSQIDLRAGFGAVLDAVRAEDIAALSHADVPFERLVEVLAPARSQARHPLFQVALTFHNYALPEVRLPGLSIRPETLDTGVAKFDLQFTVLENHGPDGRPAGLDIEISYASDLFDAETIAGLAGRFDRVLASVVADDTVVVGDIPLLTLEESVRVLHEWAGTGPDIAEFTTLADRFAAAAALDPAAPAVRAGDVTLAYDQLDARSNRLARCLIAAGVGPESLVAVALPRTEALAVALLAVIKAGGGYLPIDPNYPADRIAYVIDDARPVCAISSTAAGLPPGWIDAPVIELDTVDLDGYAAAPITDRDRRAPLRPADTAYVIYTSGSTGRPKGVVIPHRNVIRLFDNAQGHYGFRADDVWTMFHSYAFDFSVWELWGALLYGGSVVMVDWFTSRSPQQFRELLSTAGVTVLNQTPSAFYQLITADAESESELALRYVIFGGEALEPQRLAGWFDRHPQAPALINMYGITETTVHVSYRPIGPDTGSASVIGGALPGLTVRVLDSRLRPVPIGVPGEIYVSGGQLARGYLDRPGLTAGRFVADPYGAPGESAYRTGDLARWTATGDLEYLGRIDQQVNLHGFRVELGEIEAALLRDARVRETAVIVRHDEAADVSRLVGYVVPAPEAVLDTAELRSALAAELPEHMVPAALVVVDRIPLTVNGKLDRAALPSPVFEGGRYRQPATVAEELVATVYADLLGLERVGADDDFFALGGSSLLAAKAVARIGALFDTTVGVRALFEAPTVAALAVRVQAEADGPRRPALVAGGRPEQLPLSPAQQRMWFLNRFDRDSLAYNIPVALRLSGELDVPALEAAFAAVIERHESLRTVYPELADGPAQVIHPAAEVISELKPVDATEHELVARITELATTTFDVTVDVPVRVLLLRLVDADGAPTGEHVLAGVLHHISADGSSVVPFVRDLMIAYNAALAGVEPGWSPLAVQYADYALWQRALLGAEDDPESVAAKQLAYWRETLAGLPDQLDLPADHPRPARQSLRGSYLRLPLDAELHAGLTDLGRRHGATLFMVVHAAWAALLSRLSGSSDIAVGTPIAGRGEAALDDVIGMFVNTLVLRTGTDAAEPFSALLARVRAGDIAAFGNADVPFERLVEVLNPVRSTARHPLVQVGLSFQNHERATLELPGLTVSEVEFDTHVAQFDLHLFAVDRYADSGAPAGLELTLGYAHDLFTESTAQRFTAALARVLETIAAQPDIAIGDIDLLGAGLRRRILHDWNATAHPLTPATLADLFDAQVASAPDAVALLDNTGTALTYAEFDARVNRLARRLITAGVGPETAVVLAMRRGLHLVIAMYAVVKAGGAYVPIDPDHPADRIQYVVDTAKPVCVLTTSRDAFELSSPPHPDGTDSRHADGTDSRHADGTDSRHPGALFGRDPHGEALDSGQKHAGMTEVLRVDELDLSAYSAEPVADADRLTPLRPDNTAYVIFTSGSTGRPKGVAISHAAIVNQLRWLRATFALGASDRALLKTPATFDLSVWEFWSALTSGGSLLVSAAGEERDPDRLRALIAEHGVTVLHPVPSLLGMLLAAGPLPESVRAVLAIGEALPAATAGEFLDHHPVENGGGAALFNLYGPTEAAVSITAFPVRERHRQAVPIGAPAWNSRVYVLDARLSPVPVGVPGELYLSGAQLARGYFGRPALTADRFVADPYASGRMYRTGDIVRWREDGALEYVERADFQVKIGGFRIELGEVETALRRRPGVTAAVAVARDTADAGACLVAYAAVPGAAPERREEIASALRAALTAELPRYMVPAALMVLDALPLNANGKVDRAQLPAPGFTVAAYREPVTAVERAVAAGFAEVIGTPGEVRVGLDTDFFALGGNSLMATRLAARLGSDLGVRVPVSALFETPTVAGLATWIADADPADALPPLVRRTGPGPAPLSLAQQRMWVLNRLRPESGAYNVPMAIRLTGTLDRSALTAALRDVLARHEILRTRYPEIDGEAVQVVLEVGEPAGELTPIPVSEHDLAARLLEVATTGFDVTAAPPVRVALFELAADEHVLIVVLHHISADGYSVLPMSRDLVLAYTSRTAGAAPAWTPLEVQYGDYAAWQRAVLGSDADPESLLSRQLAFWVNELSSAPDQLDLPTDRARPARREMLGRTIDFEIDSDTVEHLSTLARAHGATLFGVVHAAFAVLLAKLSGQRDISVGVPVAGRGERALDDLIGMFVNTVVLRTEVDGKLTFTDLLRQVRDRDLAAFDHGDVPFERVVEAVLAATGRARSAAVNPLFQVAFAFQNMTPVSVELPGLTVAALEPELIEAKFDLQLTGIEKHDETGRVVGLDMRFGYATDIFDADSVRLLAQRLRLVLDAVVADPEVSLRAIDIRTEAERHRRPGAGAPKLESPAPHQAPADLPALIAAAAAAAPEAVAFAHGEHSVTYRDLAEKIAVTARAMGAAAKPEALVNVALAGLVPGILTALGAAGLPRALSTLTADAQARILRSESTSEGSL
ncbi:amino acid adenylation domain-containing protein [Nocardia yunnanensis]|uniref:Amino acid adenylation domain-containing protein n=1 Tax=Nocardia yunnanensis TaxID=2382165 RepID=A0A386ZAL2_9NOCA|nr:non-ribosomal peptide synthase/polyketide synthase [Nocardia yunnanensis]AYF73655.1 amino acid adenylation domain-containing protein [Nocardia yunnanensis]